MRIGTNILAQALRKSGVRTGALCVSSGRFIREMPASLRNGNAATQSHPASFRHGYGCSLCSRRRTDLGHKSERAERGGVGWGGPIPSGPGILSTRFQHFGIFARPKPTFGRRHRTSLVRRIGASTSMYNSAYRIINSNADAHGPQLLGTD